MCPTDREPNPAVGVSDPSQTPMNESFPHRSPHTEGPGIRVPGIALLICCLVALVGGFGTWAAEEEDETPSYPTGVAKLALQERVVGAAPFSLAPAGPLFALDPIARAEVIALFREFAEKQKHLIISSHILHELAELCTTVGIIEQGELLLHGSIQDIIHRARTGTKVHIKVAEQQDLAAELLGKTRGVRAVDMVDGRVVIDLEKKTDDFNALTKLLLQNNFKIKEIQEEDVNLETAFMRLTKGMVQ